MFHLKSNSFFYKFLTAMLSTLLLVGCTMPASTSSQSDGSGYLFTISIDSNPKSLDPQYATDSSSLTIITNLYEGLIEEDESGNITPAGASDYTISDDGLIYTFHLNTNRYWYYDKNQDDVIDDDETWLVTAQDYVYAFQRIFDSNTQSPYSKTYSAIKNGIDYLDGKANADELGVHAISDYELQFVLDEPDIMFLHKLSLTAALPCNENFFLSTKGQYGLDQTSVASCGAFYMRLWFYDPYGKDNLIYLRRNTANSAARSVYPSNLTFHIRKNAEETQDDFSNGESDVYTTNIYNEEYMKNNLVMSDYSMTLGLVFNPDNKTFSNSNLRKALAYSIQSITLEQDSNGDLLPATGIISPDASVLGDNYREQVSQEIFKSNESTEQIQKYYENALSQLGIATLDSTKILVCQNYMDCDYLHDIIQTWQEFFGFYIGIEEVTLSEYNQRIADNDFTIAVYGVSGETSNPYDTLKLFSSNSDFFGYSNHNVDVLLSNLNICSDRDIYFEYCQELEQYILSDNYFIPLYYKNKYLIASQENEDIQYDAFSGIINLRDAKHFD